MAYRARGPWSPSPGRSRRWGDLITGRRVAGGRPLQGKGCERHTDLPRVDVVHWNAACDRKTHEQFGEGPGEKAAMTSLAVYSTYAPASSRSSRLAFGCFCS